MDFKQKLGHICNMGTLIFWQGLRSNIKVEGHPRSKGENVKVASFEKLKSDWNQT